MRQQIPDPPQNEWQPHPQQDQLARSTQYKRLPQEEPLYKAFLMIAGLVIVILVVYSVHLWPQTAGDQSTTTAQMPAQTEAEYKANTIYTTVANLDKDGNADKGEDVHFLSKILSFVKDSDGNTAGANVSDPYSYSISVIQVLFTPGTDITRLNGGDTLEVWGNNEGVFSGTNAFGVTIQEVAIAARYMFDQTTNYQVDA